MGLIGKLLETAKSHQVKIGIGSGNSGNSRTRVQDSIKKAADLGYGEIILFDSPSELISALKMGEIDGAVRGSLPAKEALTELKLQFNLTSLYRAALMSIDEEHCFFLAPVGIDEGIFIDERLQFIKMIDPLLKHLGESSKTAIISGGRPEDLGRSGVVDESLQAGEKLLAQAKELGFDAKHYGVLIEEAYKESNVIIAPNGIVGNLLFRTLHLLGNSRSFGAPVLNLDKVFIDTSRSKNDYADSIMLASALIR
jgi:putative methanogen marker protein 4